MDPRLFINCRQCVKSHISAKLSKWFYSIFRKYRQAKALNNLGIMWHVG